MLKHRGFPSRLPGTDLQFTIRRASKDGATPLKARERYADRRAVDRQADATFLAEMLPERGEKGGVGRPVHRPPVGVALARLQRRRPVAALAPDGELQVGPRQAISPRFAIRIFSSMRVRTLGLSSTG